MFSENIINLTCCQGFSLGLSRSLVIVVRPVGDLSEVPVVLAVTPDPVHNGVRGLLREVDGLSRVVIVIMRHHLSHKTGIIVTIGVRM